MKTAESKEFAKITPFRTLETPTQVVSVALNERSNKSSTAVLKSNPRPEQEITQLKLKNKDSNSWLSQIKQVGAHKSGMAFEPNKTSDSLKISK